MSRAFALFLFAPLLVLAALPAPSTASAAASVPALLSGDNSAFAGDSPFDEARKLLKSGDIDEAKDAGLLALAANPYSREGYEFMRDVADEEGDTAGLIRWNKWLYWSLIADRKTKTAEEVGAALFELYPNWNADEEILETWQDAIHKAAKASASAKQYRLAGHLMDKLIGLRPNDKKLAKEYAKLQKKAGGELTGGSFAAASIRRKSQRWLDKENAAHIDRENPFERKTKHYDLYTNISWQFAETAAAAMDEINEFYRSVYSYKKKAKATIWCLRKRSDFDRMTMEIMGNAMPSRGVGGYWTHGLKTVVAYDRSFDEAGYTQDDIWKTLFHEASHQFMTLLTKDRHIPPCWLNEGTSCYFEGCVIKADGTILKNAPANQRLREWWAIEHSPNKHSLHELIAHERNIGPDEYGMLSYEGDYYAYGWALVYFLLNYEEGDRRVAQALTGDGAIPDGYKAVRKAGRLVYREPYLKYLEHFSKRGCEGDPEYAFEMAKKFFVEEVNDPDVPDWAAFEKRWRMFTTSLYHELNAGWEFADVLQARSRGYLMGEDYERARITAEQADAKRSNDAETYGLLAEASLGEDRKGDAVYWMTRRWEMLWNDGDEEGYQEAEAWLDANGGKRIVQDYCLPTTQALVALQAASEEADMAGHPILGALFASHGLRAFDSTRTDLTIAGKQYAVDADQDLRMWQRAFQKGPEANRSYIGTFQGSQGEWDLVTYNDDGVLLNNPEGGLDAETRCDTQGVSVLSPPFKLRGDVQWEGKQGAGLMLGFGTEGRPRTGINLFGRPDKQDKVVEFFTVKTIVDVRSGQATLRPMFCGGQAFRPGLFGVNKMFFEISVDAEGKGKVSVDGSDSVDLPEEFTKELITGGFSIRSGEGAVALFSKVDVLADVAFWPVE